jgi:hypothetical protein
MNRGFQISPPQAKKMETVKDEGSCPGCHLPLKIYRSSFQPSIHIAERGNHSAISADPSNELLYLKRFGDDVGCSTLARTIEKFNHERRGLGAE